MKHRPSLNQRPPEVKAAMIAFEIAVNRSFEKLDLNVNERLATTRASHPPRTKTTHCHSLIGLDLAVSIGEKLYIIQNFPAIFNII